MIGKPHRVVAAIDFGTYGTGFAWTTVSQGNSEMRTRRISFFEDWEDQKLSYPKNRSALLLDAEGRLLSWGYQAVTQRDAMPAAARWRLLTGFKMSLQRNLGSGDTVSGDAGVVLAGDAPDAFRLAVLCLEQVYAKARDHITRGAYQESDIRWCVTVPAIWDQYTRDLMYKAAVEAGLPNDPERLLLAQEPAAAALYCTAKGEALLRTAGTRFLVVDAGGGTVDITSYQVAGNGRLDELAPASGAKTGSDYLNEAFMNEVLVRRFGLAVISRILRDQRSAIAGTMDAWERAKRSFSADSADDLVIPLSAPFYAALVGEKASGRWDGSGEPVTEVVVSHDLVASLFDQRIDETIGCVEQQLQEMRSASGVTGGEVALLVGGFAESPYLRSRLGDRLADRGVRVVVPEQPSIAVLAGAVHFAYNPSVFMTWRAPFTVGIKIALPFRQGHDPESKKVIGNGNRELCDDRFDIFVVNRAAVLTSEPIKRTYWPLKEEQTAITIRLFSTPSKDVEYVTEEGVDPLGSLTVDLPASMGQLAGERAVEVAMHLGQTHIRVEARNIHTNEPQSATIQWNPTW